MMWAERNSSTTEQSNEVDEWVNLNSAECGDVAGFEADAETVLPPAAWPSLPIGFDLVNEFEGHALVLTGPRHASGRLWRASVASSAGRRSSPRRRRVSPRLMACDSSWANDAGATS